MENENSMFPESIGEKVYRCGVIAVLVIDKVEHAVPLAKTLLGNGIGAMELTLRTPAAMGALEAVRKEVPDMLAGIGTLLTPEQVKDVANAGAQFGVSPGFNRRVVRAAKEAGLPFAPGIATPTDLEAAIEEGCTTVKYFPAETMGGIPHLKSMGAPYAHLGIKYIPLGGVNLDNLSTYLSEFIIPAVGGSWIAPRGLIQNEEWGVIAANAAEVRQAIDKIRS